MKLKELKKILDNLTPEQLEKEFWYNSENYSMSGPIIGFTKVKSNLYWTGEDDPSPLFTRTQLLEDGYDKFDIEEMDIAFTKGDFYIEF